MAILRVAIGGAVYEFGENTPLDTVWSHIHATMAAADVDTGIVLMDDGGETLGQIWDRSQYFAHWETPSKMRAYFNLVGFDTQE